MMADPTLRTYTNPVYPDSFPDPFVLKHGGEYFAFCTGHAKDGRIFGVLTSTDLVTWHELPGAMEALPPEAGPFYWAPEVAHLDGTFYLYYSVGNETFMQLRVATSREPAGPYLDSGRRLTLQDFAIDAHVFVDDDGSRHMFYATDFLEHSHIGTGTVVDRMIDPFTLEGDPRPVTRAKYDWQVYDPSRESKGGVRWHTVEGPFVLKRKGKYFEMFSGGNWQNITYGVGYAVSDRIYCDNEWQQQVNGSDTLPLLHTIPEKVIGPGHNSVVLGPDNRQLYCVYHRWQDDKRVMCIDRMDLAGGDRMFVAGPSYGPQPFPFESGSKSFEDTFEDNGLDNCGWSATDDSLERGGDAMLVMSGGAPVRISKEVAAGDFELAVNCRLDVSSEHPSLSIARGGTALTLSKEADGWHLDLNGHNISLADNFLPTTFHQFRILNAGRRTSALIDGREVVAIPGSTTGERLEITVQHATAVLDMVRYTLLTA